MAKDKPPEGEAPKKGKGKLIIVIAVVVLLLGGGGAGGYFYFFAGEKEEPAPVPGIVVALDPITINLADGHFLKISIALQATLEVHDEPDGSQALDIMISHFSNKSVAELSSNEAREGAKKKLKEAVMKAYHGEVMDLYFTEFVMQ